MRKGQVFGALQGLGETLGPEECKLDLLVFSHGAEYGRQDSPVEVV